MSKGAVISVLNRLAEDAAFNSQMVQNPSVALEEFALTSQEITAIITGDVRWVESHIGAKVDKNLLEKFFIPLLSKEQW